VSDDGPTDDFPRPTLDEWQTEAERVLRGKPLSSVTWTTEDGIEVPPVVPELDEPAPPTPTRAGRVQTCTTADSEEEIAGCVEAGFDLVSVWYDHEEDADVLAAMNLEHVLLDPMSPSQAIAAVEDLPQAAGVVLGTEWMHYVESGTPAQQIGWVLSAAVDVLTELDAEHADRVYLEVAIGPDILTEVAKLRAIRRLWAEIAAERGLSNSVRLLAACPSFPFTRMDAESNLLRAALAGFAAIAGGADVIEMMPYRHGSDEAEEARLALGQVRMMLEESSLHSVVDPFAGAAAVELLTDGLVDAGRVEFHRIRKLQGFMVTCATGDDLRLMELVEPYADAHAARTKAVKERRRTIVGVNRFVDPTRDGDAPRIEDAELAVGKWSIPGTPLSEFRVNGVVEFEYLRERMQWHEEAGRARATVTLLPLGPVGWRRARADFAADFFRSGGFTIDDPGGFESATDALSHARREGAPIVVICSDDQSWGSLVPRITESLADRAVYVAGRPPVGDDSGAVTGYVFEGADAVTILCEAQDALGIRRLP